jgi:hypothetical protein
MINLVSTVLLTLFPHVHEISPGKNAIFPSIYLPHLHRMFPDSFGLQLVMQPYPTYICLIWFLFVRPEVCRQLPSDSASRRTPLLLAMCLALSTRTRDFHPLDCAHAGRTRKAPKTVRFRRYLAPLSGFEPLAFRLGVNTDAYFSVSFSIALNRQIPCNIRALAVFSCFAVCPRVSTF